MCVAHPSPPPGNLRISGDIISAKPLTAEARALAIARLASPQALPRSKAAPSTAPKTGMNSSKFDHEKMKAVRLRQQQYSKQITGTAGDQIAMQVDSITRVVVQNIRKLRMSERCALFLLDESKHELYFKPVAGLDTNVPEIRFPSKVGIAGWVATSAEMANIPDAYKDKRFNSSIDKQTGFRTRTILCMPVVDNKGHVLAVCQMVNKFYLEEGAGGMSAPKKKVYGIFDDEDEELLRRCCDKVAEPLMAIRKLQENEAAEAAAAAAEARKNCLAGGAQDFGHTKRGSITPSRSRRGSFSTGVMPEHSNCSTPGRRESASNLRGSANSSPLGIPLVHSRRPSAAGTPEEAGRSMSSVAGGMSDVIGAANATKDLINFMQDEVKSKTTTVSNTAFGDSGAGVAEQNAKFQFREAHGPQMTAKGQTLDSAEKREAIFKDKRKKAYTAQVQDSTLDATEVAMNTALRNMMTKFKQMLDCERCGLFFVDEDTDELYFHVEEEGASIRFPKTKGIAGAVAANGEPLLISDPYKDSRFNKDVDKITNFTTRNILCQPVKDAAGTVLAVVQMINSRKDGGFDKKDQEQLLFYASKVSQGLVAIRDSDKDGASSALAGSRMARVDGLNMVMTEIHGAIDAETKAVMARRKEESRNEYTANEAASRFQFRDWSDQSKDKKNQKEKENTEQEQYKLNQAKFDDIFSGKMEMKGAEELLRDERISAKEEAKAKKEKEKQLDARSGGRRKSVSVFQAGTKDNPQCAAPTPTLAMAGQRGSVQLTAMPAGLADDANRLLSDHVVPAMQLPPQGRRASISMI